MILPEILIIDDQFGQSITDRRNLCLSFSLKDVTEDDDNPEEIKNPVAESYFCTSQREENGFLVNDPSLALSVIKEVWPDSHGYFWSLVLLDIRFVSGKIMENGEAEGQVGDSDFGITILEEINSQLPDVPVVMLSSRERYEVIDKCRKRGATDFIQRIGYSSDITSHKKILQQKLFEHALLPDTRVLDDEKLRIAGKSLSILKALRSARRAVIGKGNILLIDESGTGKDLFARFIRDISLRPNGPYEIFHPTGRSETLQEDEFFGHVKGSFTGATSDKAGLFERANGGTVFIDEIADISESLQLKLLRPLENKSVKRLGGINEIDIDVQVVFATSKKLEELTRTGKYNSDFLNRINAYKVIIPPFL